MLYLTGAMVPILCMSSFLFWTLFSAEYSASAVSAQLFLSDWVSGRALRFQFSKPLLAEYRASVASEKLFFSFLCRDTCRTWFVFGLLLFETWLLQDVSRDSTSSLVNHPITRTMIFANDDLIRFFNSIWQRGLIYSDIKFVVFVICASAQDVVCYDGCLIIPLRCDTL